MLGDRSSTTSRPASATRSPRTWSQDFASNPILGEPGLFWALGSTALTVVMVSTVLAFRRAGAPAHAAGPARRVRADRRARPAARPDRLGSASPPPAGWCSARAAAGRLRSWRVRVIRGSSSCAGMPIETVAARSGLLCAPVHGQKGNGNEHRDRLEHLRVLLDRLSECPPPRSVTGCCARSARAPSTSTAASHPPRCLPVRSTRGRRDRRRGSRARAGDRTAGASQAGPGDGAAAPAAPAASVAPRVGPPPRARRCRRPPCGSARKARTPWTSSSQARLLSLDDPPANPAAPDRGRGACAASPPPAPGETRSGRPRCDDGAGGGGAAARRGRRSGCDARHGSWSHTRPARAP